MSHIVINGWSGRREIPVGVIGETLDAFQIVALEPVFMPGRGMLRKGELALIPKCLVELQPAAQMDGARASMRMRVVTA